MLLLLGSCNRSEYDPSDGVNTEMTLFGEEIYVPIGQVGPITVKMLLNSNTNIQTLLNELLKEESDGTFYIESKDKIYSMNAFRVALDIPDPTQPYHWEIGSRTGSVAPTAALLRMFNIGFANQHLTISALNPVMKSLTLNSDIWVRCRDNSYVETYSKEFKLEDYTLRSSYSESTLASLDIPAEVMDLVTSVELNNLTLDLPANVKDWLHSSDDSAFTFSTQLKANVALSEKFTFPYKLRLSKLNAALGKFRLHKCQLAFDLENTLPLDATINSIKLLDEQGNEMEDIVFSSDVKILGGKLGAPTVTPVVLQVEALTGTIPDIHEVLVDFKFDYSPTAGTAVLSSAMGLSVKSASVKLFGGITLFGK